jgi:anti-sigma factor RsiW
MMQHPFDDIHTFGLGELPRESAEALLDHADHCPSCAVLVAEAMQGVGALASDAPPRASAEPLRAFAPAVPASAAKRRSGRNSMWPGVAGLATAASLALFAWNMQLRSDRSPLAPPPVASLVHSHFVHHPLTGPSGAGGAKAIVAADGSWVFVVADQLAPENQFDVWETRGGKQIKLGSLTSDDAGEGSAYFALPAAKAEGFALVPSGADPATDSSALRWP